MHRPEPTASVAAPGHGPDRPSSVGPAAGPVPIQAFTTETPSSPSAATPTNAAGAGTDRHITIDEATPVGQG